MWKILFILFIGFLSADYGGGYAGSGFRYGSNAREFSLGGAIAADKTPGFYAFSNPALLKFVRSNQIGVSMQTMALGRSIQSFSFVKELPPSAGVGLAVLRAGTDNIHGRNAMNEYTKTFSSQEIEGIISFGVSLGSCMAIGINIKTFFSNIAPEIIDIQSGTGIGFDVGIIYRLHRHLTLGGVFENINGKYNWKLTKNDDQDSYVELLPQTIKLAIAYKGYDKVAIYFQQDIVRIPDNYINYRSRIGIEYHLSNDIKFRTGLKQGRGISSSNEKTDINLKPSIGVGLPLNIWQGRPLNLDYALDPGQNEEGLSHLFSFSIKLK